MTQLVSAIDPQSDAFRENADAMEALIADLRARTAEAALGGSERSRERHVSRGKLLPRDRVGVCWTPARPSWRSAPWRPTACMRAMSTGPA